jgi:hypothetical protein
MTSRLRQPWPVLLRGRPKDPSRRGRSQRSRHAGSTPRRRPHDGQAS